MPNYRVKIDVTKLDKTAFFKGAKGTYCDLVLWENEEPDEYGNTHSVKQDMGKDRRGEKTPYVGNAKNFGGGTKGDSKPAGQKQVTNETQPDDDTDDIPF